MKKLGMLLMLVVAMTMAMPTMNAQSERKIMKARQKEMKAKMKEYKKGGWEIYGTSRSMEKALLDHYAKLEEDGAQEVPGVASSFLSKNVGMQSAANSAINFYARQCQSFVRGRITSDMFNDADDIPSEFDKFCAAYESLVVKEIKGEMEHSYSVIRSKGKDKEGKETFEMMSFYVVNEAKASRARQRAMENAFKESELSQKYAEKVSNFVREGFKLEE